MLIRVMNSVDQPRSIWATTPTQDIAVPFHNGPGDDYRVVVHVKGYRDHRGRSSRQTPKVHKTLKLLLIPEERDSSFFRHGLS